MSTGILIITHPGIGSGLLATASRILGFCPANARCMDVPVDMNTDTAMMRALDEMGALNQGDGVLILTDVFGATPSNIASKLVTAGQSTLVSGVNLPMLLRVFNYLSDNLDALTSKAAEGGTRGIQTVRDLQGESGT